jgi:hypothetical protein
MSIAEPSDIEVVSMAPYEHIHYQSTDGRVFMNLCYESGFASYSVDIELTPSEIKRLQSSPEQFISEMRSNYASNKNYFETNREIKEFKDWAVVKLAIDKWHGR